MATRPLYFSHDDLLSVPQTGCTFPLLDFISSILEIFLWKDFLDLSVFQIWFFFVPLVFHNTYSATIIDFVTVYCDCLICFFLPSWSLSSMKAVPTSVFFPSLCLLSQLIPITGKQSLNIGRSGVSLFVDSVNDSFLIYNSVEDTLLWGLLLG